MLAVSPETQSATLDLNCYGNCKTSGGNHTQCLEKCMSTVSEDRGSGRIVVAHIVTLINRRTGDEQSLTIETLSDRFTDVIREVSNQKALRSLLGYEIFEALDCNTPF